MILGAPLGSTEFTRTTLAEKPQDCRRIHSLFAKILDARVRFYLLGMTASVCKVFHICRLVQPVDSAGAAEMFDADQCSAFCSLNEVKLSAPASKQIALPLKMGGHSSPAVTPLIHTQYATSILDDAKLRILHPSLPTPKFCYRPLSAEHICW